MIPPHGAGSTITYLLDESGLPASLPVAEVHAELALAFAQWSAPTGITFERLELAAGAPPPQITISFADATPRNAFAFDGPGGSLAVCDAVVRARLPHAPAPASGPCTLHPAPCTLHPGPWTLDPGP